MIRRGFSRLIGFAVIIAALFSAAGVPDARAQDLMCFEETRQCIGGRFRQFWEQNGGLQVFGFPVTPERRELNRDTGQMYLTQWFERNRFELHPENAAPYDVLLGRLGDDRLLQTGRDWRQEGREPGPQDGCLWFEQTGHNVCNQGGALGFRRYWETRGLQDPALDAYQRSLALFGLPLTAPRTETNSSGDTVLTQWFERARFEWHPGKPDEFKVLLGLLGNEARTGTNTQSSNAEWLVTLNGMVYFAADDGKNGRELWRSDGTPQGTNLVKDLVPGPGSGSPLSPTVVDGVLFFNAATVDGQGGELWRSDGTESGTVVVRDIRPGPEGSDPSQLRRVGSTLFFIANDGATGYELWKSDGTFAGTARVRDIRPGSASSAPPSTERNTGPEWGFTDVGGVLYFAADDGANGAEIWRSDGTEAGTRRVTNTPEEYAAPTNLTNVGGALFFTWVRSDGFTELWRTDGSAAGARRVKDWGRDIVIGTRLRQLTNLGGTLFFEVNTIAGGSELWKSDGAAEGTVLVKDIDPGAASAGPSGLTVVGGVLYFAAQDAEGRGLWRSDGTAAGTVRLARVDPLNTPRGDPRLSAFTELNGALVFFARGESDRHELWRSDGSPGGTRRVTTLPGRLSPPAFPAAVGAQLFFAYEDETHGAELWRTDLTAEGTALVRDINTSP